MSPIQSLANDAAAQESFASGRALFVMTCRGGNARRSLCSIVVLIALTLSRRQGHRRADACGFDETAMARLVDTEKKAAGRAATVEVTVSGVALTDPAMANEKPVAGQAHLHYQVDKGPVVATTAAKLSFHELTPGSHTIVVVLAGNDHKPLGPQQQLTVTVPKEMKSTAAGESNPSATPATKPAETNPPAAPTGLRVVQ